MQGFTRSIVGFGIGLLGLALATPALATDPHLPPGYTGDSSAVANATAIAGASATATGGAATAVGGGANVTNVNTNVNAPSFKNENYQGQGQVQGQHQKQGQAQGQNNNQQIAPSQSVSVDASTNFDRYAPPVSAPGLTAAGTGVCLGSVSIGLSGPMAGASFGITKTDSGCEQRSAAALLYQMGYKDAAVRLLMKNDDVREALGADAPPAAKKAEAAPVIKPSAELQDNRGPAVTKTALQERLELMQGM